MSEIKVDTLTGKTTANDITVTVGASATSLWNRGWRRRGFVIKHQHQLLTHFNSLNISD